MVLWEGEIRQWCKIIWIAKIWPQWWIAWIVKICPRWKIAWIAKLICQPCEIVWILSQCSPPWRMTWRPIIICKQWEIAWINLHTLNKIEWQLLLTAAVTTKWVTWRNHNLTRGCCNKWKSIRLRNVKALLQITILGLIPWSMQVVRSLAALKVKMICTTL